MLKTVYWDAGTARPLRSRTRGPVFVTPRRPGPGKVLAPRDVYPDTGLARLSYGQARALLDQHTADERRRPRDILLAQLEPVRAQLLQGGFM